MPTTKYKLYNDDCRVVCDKVLQPESIDSVICDPPYGLKFMGKDWDHGIPGVPFWSRIMRVCKPGAILLAFGGTRTYHRLACAIEDAGWEIRDCVMWVYGSGFPKSLNISKSIDKAAPRVGMFNEFAKHFAEHRNAANKTQKELAKLFPSKTGGLTGCIWNWENGANVPTVAQWRILQPILGLSLKFLPLIKRVETEREVMGQGMSGTTAIWQDGGMGEFDITAPATEAAKQWDGWGTALKPAYEPILVAMKPLDGTYAENAIKHGVAGINVDGCRVETEDKLQKLHGTFTFSGGQGADMKGKKIEFVEAGLGRFPANLIHDGSEEVLAKFPKTKSTGRPNCVGKEYSGVNEKNGNVYGDGYGDRPLEVCYEDSGSAARFFYCAKSSKRERGAENCHPTVKPIALMEYLCKLTMTPTGGIVLDPFMGSGSTGVACANVGRRFIGIENDTEHGYFEIAKQRVKEAYRITQTRRRRKDVR